ncbi:WD40 repeat protein [Kutzneria buriramensis]|uniref:WD40 repeat protein n=1 Tax=Kutzneria buriramensis TaxID=1045776 RepID=A0A3E0I6Y5_9PSEU|nr:WD40 repeat protein [Kutzneria buriramensis]
MSRPLRRRDNARVALHRIGTAPTPRLTETFTLPLPDGGLHSIVVLPDGDTCVVSAENDGTLYLVSLGEGRAIDRLVGHSGPVNSLALADAGRLLLSASDDETIRVWDTRSWRTVFVLAGHSGYVREVAGQGLRAVSGGEDRTVRVWDLSDGTCLAVFDSHVSSVDHVAVSPDGMTAASAGRDNQVLLWDLDGLRLSRELYGTDQFIREMPDLEWLGDTWILCGANETGRGHQEAPTALHFDDSSLYTAAHEIIRWDLSSGSEVARFPRQGYIRTLATFRDFVAAGSMHGARVSRPDGESLATFAVVDGSVVDMAYLPDGQLVTAHEPGSLKLWPALGGDERDSGRHRGSVTDLVVSGDGTLAASVGLTGEVLLWDVGSGTLLATVESHDVPCEPVFMPSGLLVVAERRRLHLVSRNGDQRILAPVDGIVSLAVIDDQSLLVVLYDSAPEVWSLDGSRRPLVGEFGGGGNFHPLIAGRYALVPCLLRKEHSLVGGAPVSVLGVRALQCWDLVSGELVWTLHGRITAELTWGVYGWVVQLADGAIVTTREVGDVTSLAVLDAATGETHQELPLPKGSDLPCVETLDGTLLFVHHDELVSGVWGIDPDEDVLLLRLQLPRSRAIRLVPDRNLLIRLGDREVFAHRLSSGREITAVRLPADGRCLAVAGDGDVVVVGDSDGGMHFFQAQWDKIDQ